MRLLDKKEIEHLQGMLKARHACGENKLRTAIYARKSAEDEKQTSIPTQIAQCKALISQHDFLKLTHTFSEDNVSGMFTDERHEFQAMMALAEAKEIDVIVVMKLDRLARDLSDSATTIKLLNIYGCYLIAGDDVSDSATPAGEFMRNILLAQNQYHARRVASDVMAAECNNAKQGKNAGGIAPYGLKTVDKFFELDEKEAPAVKMMFEMYSRGNSYKEIIDKLDSLGYKTRAGNRFSYSTLHTILRNDKYYGTYVYNRVGGKRKKNRVLIEKFDEIRNSEAIPPIISKDLFDDVQAKLEGRKLCLPKQNTCPDFVLTGLITCKCCGKSMSGGSQVGGRNKTRRRFYRCPNHISRNGCTCTTKDINADYLENAIKDMITDYINSYLPTQSSSILFAPAISELKEKRAVLSRHIFDLKSKASKLLDKAVNTSKADLVSRYEEQASECFNLADDKQAELNNIDKHIAQMTDYTLGSVTLSTEDIFTSYDLTRELIRIFVERIEIDDANDDIRIVFHS